MTVVLAQTRIGSNSKIPTQPPQTSAIPALRTAPTATRHLMAPPRCFPSRHLHNRRTYSIILSLPHFSSRPTSCPLL